MAGRIRSIKPEILDDGKAARLTHIEWRLFVSSWLLADDHGNFRADTDYLLGAVFWGSGESPESLRRAAGKLVSSGLVTVYRVKGQTYCHITNWDRHQKISHVGKGRMPAPSHEHAEAFDCFPESSGGSPESIGESPESLRPDLRSPTSDLRPATTEYAGASTSVSHRPKTKAKKPPHPDHERARAHWFAYWSRKHGGEPTWDGKSAAHLGQLVSQHGGDEVIRRIGLLESNQPSWPERWTFATFRTHFDLLTAQRTLIGRTEPRQPHEYPDGEVDL